MKRACAPSRQLNAIFTAAVSAGLRRQRRCWARSGADYLDHSVGQSARGWSVLMRRGGRAWRAGGPGRTEVRLPRRSTLAGRGHRVMRPAVDNLTAAAVSVSVTVSASVRVDRWKETLPCRSLAVRLPGVCITDFINS